MAMHVKDADLHWGEGRGKGMGEGRGEGGGEDMH